MLFPSSGDFTARVWDAGTGQELARKTHDSQIRTALFSPDGKYVATGGDDRMLRVWTPLLTAEMSRMIFPGKVYSVAFSPDGKYALAGGAMALPGSGTRPPTGRLGGWNMKWHGLFGRFQPRRQIRGLRRRHRLQRLGFPDREGDVPGEAWKGSLFCGFQPGREVSSSRPVTIRTSVSGRW